MVELRLSVLGPGVECEVRDEALAGLLARVAGGDLDALGSLYDAVAPEMFAIAHWRTGSRMDAADCVQDVFVKLASSPAMVAGIRHARRCLLTMAHRAAVDRTRGRRRDQLLDVLPFLEATGGDPDRAMDAASVTRMLRELPEAQREAIYLHHFADLSFREIGGITAVPTFTAASRYRLGMTRLRALLGETR